MAVASLILGILGFVIFSWLGPLVGASWAGLTTAGSFIEGQPSLVTWPLLAVGITVGVVFPLLAVALGAVAMAKSDKKGIALGGIVTGALGALGGAIITFVIYQAAVLTATHAGDMVDDPKMKQQMDLMMQQLNDTDFQRKIQQAMQRQAGGHPARPSQAEPLKPMQPVDPPAQPAAPPGPQPGDTAAPTGQPAPAQP